MPDPTPPTIRVRLELHGEDDPIRGVVRDDRGEAQPFSGWLALMKRLDALRSGGSHEGPRSASDPRSPS